MPDQRKPSNVQDRAGANRHHAARGHAGGNMRTPASAGKRASQPLGTIGGGQYVGEDHSFGFDEEGLHIPTGNSELLLSRRQLLLGAVGIATVAAAGGAVASLGGNEGADQTGNTLAVDAGEVFTLDDCAETPVEDALVQIGEYKLPYGSLVWAGNDTVAACLLPTEQAKPLATAALLSLTSGNQSTVLEHAVNQDAGFEVYDIRASDEGAIWTEANILSGEWRVYVAPISMMELQEHHQVDSGDASMEMPTLAAVGDTAFWQVMPVDPGKEADTSQLQTQVRKVVFGQPGDVRTIYTAAGRCATALYPATQQKGVVITPASPESKTHRQMLVIDANGQVIDQVTFPSRMTPMEACYGPSGFAFSFESIYNYGDGIANLGTYTPQQKPGVGDYSHKKWFRFARTPSMPPAWCDQWFMVKSTSAVVAVNLADQRYAVLPTDNNAEIYGDCLASMGGNGTVVTYSNIDRTAAVQDNEQVTENDRLCLVRVWATPDTAGYTSSSSDKEESEEEY